MQEINYLPIGSVVLLQGGSKKVMITGFCVTPNDNTHKMYDYSGCLYPEGVINSNEVCLFNHSQIEEVYFTGYESEEESIFKEELARTMENIKLDEDHNIIEANLSDNIDTSLENTQTFSINDSIFN